MKQTMQIAALIIATISSTAGAQTYQTGLADLEITDSAGNRNLEGFIWYPTEQATAPAPYHGNAVWAPIEAVKDAAPAPGTFPVVVLSHGMYGNAMNQSWLATALAQRGYIVAAVNHPGTSTWARDPEDARRMWQRPRDVTRVIDYFTDGSGLAGHVDAGHIFMAGHSLGGFTAIELAGGRYDAAAFAGFCDAHPDELVCGIFNDWKVARTPADINAMGADLSDPRIRGFAVFDLGGTQTFSAQSLAAIRKPLLVFGAPNNIHGMDLDIESRALVASVPAANVTYLEPAGLSHFDFLGECTAKGLDVLKDEEPDDAFVCTDGTTERHAEHQMIIDTVDQFFAGL